MLDGKTLNFKTTTSESKEEETSYQESVQTIPTTLQWVWNLSRGPQQGSKEGIKAVFNMQKSIKMYQTGFLARKNYFLAPLL